METKKRRTKVVTGMLALAGLLLVWTFASAGDLEPSAAPGPTMKTLDEVEPRIAICSADLPLTISESGSYYLTEDVNFTDPNTNAINIDGDNVTIDLMGYTLKGPDSGTSRGIYTFYHNNIEIRNGTVRDFYYGVYFTSSSEDRVIDVRSFSNNGMGISLNGHGHLVRNCIAAENGGTGIFMINSSTVIGNIAYQNGAAGIFVGDGCTVTNNTVYDNGSYGINVDSGCTVTGNASSLNGGTGIDATNYSTITNNAVYENDGYGIYTSYNCTVTGNNCYSNGDAGIRTTSGCTIIGNTLRANSNYGIYGGTYSLIDQNTAYANGTNIYAGAGCEVGMNVAP